MSQISWLNSSIEFPSTSRALDDPNGLLAAGGDLSSERIVSAYKRGIFPWYSEGQPILWWSPAPRMILVPEQLHIGRTTKKLLRKKKFTVTVDLDFKSVINNCSTISRNDQDGTWITPEMISAYIELAERGIAHSVECWQDNELVGGLYGIALGKVFFGESMFSKVSGASKIAFIELARTLRRWQFTLIDCQQHTDYLESFGAKEVSREDFEFLLSGAIDLRAPTNWAQEWKTRDEGLD